MADLYARRRKLATIVAAASALLLTGWLIFGSLPETYARPALIAGPELSITYLSGQGRLPDNVVAQNFLQLDPATLAVRSRTLFFDPDLVCVRTRTGIVGFFEKRYRTLPGESTVVTLDQEWNVLAAVYDDATDTIWVFGTHEKSIVARRIVAGDAEPVESIASADADVERLAAVGGTRMTVAWKEKGRPHVRVWRRDRTFSIETAEAHQWTLVQVGARTLTLFFDRTTQSFSELTLQVRCCDDCGLPAPPATWTYRDAFMFLGRRVTGLSAAVDGDHVRLVLTRVAAVQVAGVPVATLQPEYGASLHTLQLESRVIRYLGMIVPFTLLVCAMSLVYLGFALMRDRRRMLLGKVIPASPYADVMQRVMAFLFDQMILGPLIYIALDITGLIADTPDTTLSDARAVAMAGLVYVINVLYFFLQEAFGGQTIGKRVVGIRVVRVGGAPLTVGRAFVRNALRCVDSMYVLLVVGFAVMFFTPRKQRVGDLVAGTIVVQAEEFRTNSSDTPETTTDKGA